MGTEIICDVRQLEKYRVYIYIILYILSHLQSHWKIEREREFISIILLTRQIFNLSSVSSFFFCSCVESKKENMPSKRSAPKGKSSKSKKSKHNNRKRAPPVYWGKPASIYVGGQSLALESAKLPESAKAVSVQDFDGTWKLDTDKSETKHI